METRDPSRSGRDDGQALLADWQWGMRGSEDAQVTSVLELDKGSSF